MSLPEKGHARLDNAWLLDLLPTLPIAGAVRLYLQARGNLHQKGAGVGEVITAIGSRDLRSIERALKALLSREEIVLISGRYYSPEFAPAETPAPRPVPSPAPSPASAPAFSSFLCALNAVSHVISQVLEEENKRTREKNKLATDLDRTSEGHAGEPSEPREGLGADAPPADAASSPALPSQEWSDPGANEGTQAPPGGQGGDRAGPPPPRREHHGDDHGAVQFFHDLAGYNFVTSYRLHLARWHEMYSPEFLRLAWKLAPTVGTIRVPSVAFVYVLNREKPWPDALREQYERDLAPAPRDAFQALPEHPCKVGDILRWRDGVTAKVVMCGGTDAGTDAEDDERGYVPYHEIGRSVEVLLS